MFFSRLLFTRIFTLHKEQKTRDHDREGAVKGAGLTGVTGMEGVGGDEEGEVCCLFERLQPAIFPILTPLTLPSLSAKGDRAPK